MGEILERRAIVREMFTRLGLRIPVIAKRLQVSKKTIYRDLDALSIRPYSDIDDDALELEVPRRAADHATVRVSDPCYRPPSNRRRCAKSSQSLTPI